MKKDKPCLPVVRLLAAHACVLAAASPAMAQQVKQDPVPAASTSATQPDTAAQSSGDEEMVVLSPFTVTTTKDQGYFAQNTLAGSRMNTNIADLGAAISVVTKQQLEDTGSLDINDAFRYEVGTEGSTTYTPVIATMRGEGIADAVGGASFGNSTTVSTNATANRVRGLGSPTMALNYYPAISAIPFDSYNTASIEISRGPNSMLFGMGSPAGIVNQSLAQATLDKNTTTLSLRVDDRGSNRASLSFNRSLIDGKLAIYGALLYNNQQFVRKPSYDLTRRQYGAITYKPFKYTTIRASVEGYNNDNRRPNSLTPVDGVSEWRKADMPVYDPISKTIKKLGTGEVVGPFVGSANSPYAQQVIDYVTGRSDFDSTKWNATTKVYNGVSIFGTGALTNVNSILYVPGITTQNQGRTVQQITDGNLQAWYTPLGGQRPPNGWGTNSSTTTYPFSTTATATDYVYGNATWADVYDRYTTNSANWSGPSATTQLKGFRYPGVTDKSIYDWTETNINQSNYGEQRDTNYNVEIEQEIIPGLLHFGGGWFRQDYDSKQSYTVAQLAPTTLFVDTNVTRPDGTPNPFLGQTYVEDFDPDQFRTSEVVDNYRGMIAFTPDFTKRGGWMKWLGHHQILGLASYMDDITTSFRDRLVYVDGSTDGLYRYIPNPLNNTAGAPTGWNMEGSGRSIHRQYYLSSPGDPYGTVTHAPGAWDNGRYANTVRTYDYTNSQFQDTDVVVDWMVHSGGTQKNARKLNSYSGGWTGYLFDDRIIATVGVRKDINRTRVTTNAATATAPAMSNAEKWVNGVYQYDTVFERWTNWDRVSGTTSTYGGVVKPFLNWSSISRRSASGNVFWEFVENFGVSYNKSDNFNAPASSNVDLFGKPLPKPTGEGEDKGIQFSLFKNKLFARVNWFEATNENALLGGTAKTAMDRLSGHTDTTAFRSWLENIYVINQGLDPTQENWRQAFDANPANRPAMEAQVADWWKLAYNYYGSLPGTVGGTSSAKAKGTEVQLNYNPTPNWTIKFTATKVKTTNSDALKEFNAWLAARSPVWDNAKATDFLLPQYQSYANGYTNFGGRNVVINNFWDSTNYNSTIKDDDINGWTTSRNYYNAVVTPQYSLAKDLEGQQVPGQRKYSGTLLTNYMFDYGALKGWSVGGAQRWADKAIIGYYGKATGADPLNPGVLDVSDTTRPIYDDATWYTDLWVGYTRKIMSDKVRMKLQLNVTDVFQGGELKPISVNFDGSPSAYRIIDSRQFILTATFDF